MTRTPLKSSAEGGCAHCGLPARDTYCCYGCELAFELSGERRGEKGALFFSVLLTMVIMMLSLFLYAEDIYEVPPEQELAWLRSFYRWTTAVLCTPVMALCGGPLLLRAFQRRVNVLSLITVGAFAAYALSWLGLLQDGVVYFDTAAAALVLATLGRYLEASAKSHTSALLGASWQRSPHPTWQLDDEDQPQAQLWPEEIQPGMRLMCPVDDAVPVDMELALGPRAFNLAVINGESEPVTLQTGASVPAGAISVSEPAIGVCVRPARASTVERLGALAKSLRTDPSSLQSLSESLGAALTPLVIALAVGSGVYWTFSVSGGRGLEVALAVLLVACPCTYAISTPLLHWLVMRKALNHGVLVRSAAALEALSKIRLIAWDKTGTLTDASLTVLRDELLAPAAEVWGLVRALEADSRHPVGRALFQRSTAPQSPLRAKRVISGAGVQGEDDEGRAVAIGAPRQLGITNEACDVVLIRQTRVLARFWLGERVRKSAGVAIERLRQAGVELRMLSGDRAAKAGAVAEALGVEYEAQLSPKDKAERLAELSSAHDGHIAMVGDGSNDAPALASVCVGIAMPNATGLSKTLSQLSLQSPDLVLIPWVLELSRRGMRSARRLLTLSTVYNTVLLLLAVTGSLKPVWAGLSMLLSSALTLGVAAHTTTWEGPHPEPEPLQTLSPKEVTL